MNNRTPPDLPDVRAELVTIISEVLEEELPPLAADTPILDIVVSSLSLVEGMRRIYEHFGVLISIRRVIEGQATLDGIAVYIQQELAQKKKKPANAPQVRTITRQIPLAPAQQHVGFLMRYSPEAAAAFNESLAVRLNGPLDGPALQAAVDVVAMRYEALHTSLNPDKDVLDIHANAPIDMQVSQCLADAVEKLHKEIASRPFLPGECLFQVDLLRITDEHHVLVLVSHALVVESEALQLVLKDLAAFYAAYCADLDPQIEFPAVQWTDYLAMGETDLARAAQKTAQNFWQEKLAGMQPRLELPGDFPRPAMKRYTGARVTVPLKEALTHRLLDWSAVSGIPVQEALFGVYGLFLSRISGQAEVMIGLRSAPVYLNFGQRVVAQTRNMLPIQVQANPRDSFRTQIYLQAAAIKTAETHRYYSLAELIQSLALPRDQSRSVLFTAAFQYQSWEAAPLFGPLEAAFLETPAAGARYDLELIVTDTATGINLSLEYSTEIYTANTITRWLEGLLVFLEAGLAASDTSWKNLPVMSAHARQQLLEGWNQTEQEIPEDKTVLDLFRAQVGETPKAPAVRWHSTTWTYQDLLARGEAFAAALTENQVVSGDRVGLLIARSPDLIAAMLGTWLADAVYVPLDGGFPENRIAFMLADAGVETVITDSDLVKLLPEAYAARAVMAENIKPPQAALPRNNAPGPKENSAYIIYTSGSTGRPKGVEVGHRALVNFLLSVQKTIGFAAQEIMLAITTVSFDISAMELLMPLLAGGVVEIASEEVLADGFALAQLIELSRPDFMQATSSIWKTLLVTGWAGQADLRICSAGESLSRDLAEELLTRGAELWNLYGPTETTVFSAVQKIESAPDQPISIGRPLANTQLYILDEFKAPVPLGVVGELYIGGDGLAEGYWGQPKLTSEKFIPHPFKIAGRLYQTGDLARYQPDGTVICLGRVDDQVKIHGVRIEMGEVEAALRKVEGVQDAVVTAWSDSRGDLQLVGHIIPAVQPPVAAAAVRAALRRHLPEVMVPPYLLYIDQFPLTANRKIRRAALPTPDLFGPGKPVPVTAPETTTEKLVAKIWAALLGGEENVIGRDSDFMDLGGHSLLMTALMVEIRRVFQVRFRLLDFFGASTIRAFSALIEARRSETNGRPVAKQTNHREVFGRQRMAFLLRESQLPAPIAPARGAIYHPPDVLRHVLLTGGTGFLGAYLIAEILRTTDAHLYCLVRPKRGESGRRRIENQMRKFQLWRTEPEWQKIWQARLHVVEGDVTLPRLGLTDEVYVKLAREVEAIIHGAAHVNFIYPYEALRATNVLGIHEIIRFAFHTQIKPVHHLSTAAIWPMGAQYTFFEKDPIEHEQKLNLGYDEAKWVGERCLMYAEERGLPVARYRPGEVGGDSVTGQCVVDHFLIASIKGFLQFGAFPALNIEVDVAPVDYVAQAITYLIFHGNPHGQAFHLTNPSRRPMRAALSFLRGLGYEFDELPFEVLRDRLVSSPNFGTSALFAYQATLEDMDDISLQLPTYDTRETMRHLAGSGIACPPADEALFATYMRYLQDINFIARPEALAARS